MLKIMQMKILRYTLVLQKGPSKSDFETTNKDFNYEQFRRSTELLKYMWSLKEEQIISEIRWSIVEKIFDQTNSFLSNMLS